jgi:hypothetical protein
MKEIYMDFGDMSRTVKFLEMPSFLPQTPSLNVSTNNQINHPNESAMLSPILENETESDSSNSSVIDLDVEV